MKELIDIINCCNSLPDGERAALATVVRTSGSTYRKPGARMLICESGPTIGSVSGGCLERDLCERAARVMKSGSPLVVRYDDGADDPIFGLGLGCGGAVEVLIEPVSRQSDGEMIPFLSESQRLRERAVIATVITAEYGSQAPVGARLGLRGGRVHRLDRSEELGEEITAWLEDEMAVAADEDRSRIANRRFINGFVEAFVEVAAPPISLAVFGAGSDAVPLTEFAKLLGWSTVVIDHRPAFANPQRFPSADAVYCARPNGIKDLIPSVDAAVIMTHNYLADVGLLKQLLAMPLRYLAVLGPRARTEMLLRDSREHGGPAAAQEMKRLHGPAGLDIGAESPEEIALAIVAEIRAALGGCSGGRLRDRMGPIHDRSQEHSPKPVDLARDARPSSKPEAVLAMV